VTQISLRGIQKSYAAGVPVIRDVDIDIPAGRFCVFLGPSGCGKSTLLRMIAGIESISAGELLIGGRRMNEVPVAQRQVAMVFQNYALYPHMSVYENMAFGLRQARVDKAEIDRRVRATAETLQIVALLERLPKALSGGQRQRVAIGRAIVREPKVFLFDEPLSNLDASLRTQMRLEMARLHERLGATIVYVTHDQVEAMTLGDRIAVFNAGRIEQVGAPAEVYRQPVNRFVAGFLGSPQMNFLPAQADRDASGAGVQVEGAGRLALPADCTAPLARVQALGVRPEHWQLLPADGALGLAASVERVEWLGDVTLVHCKLAGRVAANSDADTISVKTVLESGAALRQGATVRLHAQPRDLMLFDAQGQALAA